MPTRLQRRCFASPVTAAGGRAGWFGTLLRGPRAMADRVATCEPADGIVVGYGDDGALAPMHRRRHVLSPISLPQARRLARRLPVILPAPSSAVLVRRCRLPVMPKADLASLLLHELPRLSPFSTEEMWWHCSAPGHSLPHALKSVCRGLVRHLSGRARHLPKGPLRRDTHEVTLTLVPKTAVAPIMTGMAALGLRVDLIEATSEAGTCRLPVRQDAARRYRAPTSCLSAACLCLLLASLGIPVLRQSLALHRIEAQIASLPPAIANTPADEPAWRASWQQEADRVGDVLSHLAQLTRLIPDDTHLTNLVINGRHVLLSGRSGSASHLMTLLAADPMLREVAFAAPVMRPEGTSADTFLIRAELVPHDLAPHVLAP